MSEQKQTFPGWAAGNAWLYEKANAHFSAWANSKAGKKWRRNRNKSPYRCGYEQPEWIRDAVEALGRNDEEGFKYIKMLNL